MLSESPETSDSSINQPINKIYKSVVAGQIRGAQIALNHSSIAPLISRCAAITIGKMSRKDDVVVFSQ